MCLVLANAFLWILTVGTVDAGLQVPSEDGLTECRKIQNLIALEVLPGGGWDNLRNLDRGRVMNISYSQCKTTKDGMYFIPDQVYVVPQKQTSIDIVSEMIESWLTYKSSTSASVNAEVSFLSFLNGKFSWDSERVKTHQVHDRSVTTRIQVRNVMYEIMSLPNFQLDEGFKKRLIEIANYIENNQTRAANYYSELLVRNYGTHLLTGVHAGANLLQEDQVRSIFVSDSWSRKSSITTSAGVTFFHTVNVGLGSRTETMDEFTRLYIGNRSHSRIENNGGLPFYPGITLQKWQQEIFNQLVAIDRSGQPLSFFVSPETVPELPEPTVKKVSQTIERAINLYYTVNTHPGCLDLQSPNFNFKANIDDGSCKEMGTNFTFGGLYQECSMLSGANAQPLCQALEQRNPLTGSFSCPSEYKAILLHTGVKEEAYSQYECHRSCHSCWLIFSCCHDVCGDVYHVRRAQFKAYWCAAMGSVHQSSGYLFGGLYSASVGNPLTQTRSCPPSFYPLGLFRDLKVCVSDDYEMGFRYSTPFGGFFSCEVGNPLVDHPGVQGPGGLQSFMQKQPSPYPKRCPKGYSQHQAVISDGCQILYCVKSGTFDGVQLAPINLPPFTRAPLLTKGSISTVAVLSEYQQPWVKDTKTQMWRMAQESEIRQLFSETSSLSGGATAGISITVTLILAGLIALAFYGTKRWRNRSYQILERYSVHSNYGTAEHQDTADLCPPTQNGDA
ncbi:macrophage-expressed gene 1 protein-like [Heptranchias perlo]|uniref:macrophage-expressed gene 1 protein-like n=1 Tax=Heptranchias perlo TaxID=212740 RepID=UPI00355AC394